METTARDLNQHTAQVLARVEAGETFTVTKNGRPLAILRPYLIARGSKMAEHDAKQAQAQDEAMRSYVQTVAAPSSAYAASAVASRPRTLATHGSPMNVADGL